MDFNRREALRYLRARPDDKEAQLLVDTVYLKLRNEVQARHVLQKHRVAVDATGVTLESGTRFNSRDLAAHLKGCEEALLLGATLGSRGAVGAQIRDGERRRRPWQRRSLKAIVMRCRRSLIRAAWRSGLAFRRAMAIGIWLSSGCFFRC